MIKVSQERIVRETTAPYEYLSKGEVKTEQIRVEYYSETWNDMQNRHTRLKAQEKENPDAVIWPHQTLAERLKALPDLQTPDGRPFEITAENLGSLERKNLVAIREAIDEDIEGKSRSAK
jgi:hypothetical protein